MTRKLDDSITTDVFATAAWVCRMNREQKPEYREGKYGLWIEKVRPRVYGLYQQVYDGPDGDDWASWLVRIHRGTVYVIDEEHSDHGHYHDEYFERRYKNAPTGLTTEDLHE